MENYNCINYLLTTAQHNVFNLFKKTLSPYDITPAQYGLLNCLWKNNEATPREIANKLQLDNSTVSGILDRLEKKGFIKRSINPADRRQILISLTSQGRDLEPLVIPLVESLNERIINGFSQQDGDTIKRILKDLSSLTLIE